MCGSNPHNFLSIALQGRSRPAYGETADAVVRECMFFAAGLELFRTLPPRSQNAVVRKELPFAEGIGASLSPRSGATSRQMSLLGLSRSTAASASVSLSSSFAKSGRAASTSFSEMMMEASNDVDREATAAICAAVAAGPMGPGAFAEDAGVPGQGKGPSPAGSRLASIRDEEQLAGPGADDAADSMFRGFADVALGRRSVMHFVRQMRHTRTAIRPGVGVLE